ncbi:MAG TPA: hypothetical protein VME41_10355 [Stellaceae bacterium]|nr:hypothetical protein [Stellaceae bacterium]
MRGSASLFCLLALAACSSAPPDATKLILNDPYWKQVNVELVITKLADCDKRGPGFVSQKTIVMYKNTTQDIYVPNDATLCWRHDRDPDKPQAGAWSDWTRATLTPGESAETDL